MTTPLKTAYLIYRPVMDYEESETSYAVCKTENLANAMKDQMLQELDALTKALPIRGEDLEDKEWMSRNDARLEMIKNHKWAFGISLESDVPWSNGEDADMGCVKVSPIPYFL